MRTFLIPILILALFFVASLFLTLRQEILLKEADQSIVSLAYLNPKSDDASFFLSHQANTARTLTLEYQYPNQEVRSETVTLEPYEKKVFFPDPPPLQITVRYQDPSKQDQTLTLYKK